VDALPFIDRPESLVRIPRRHKCVPVSVRLANVADEPMLVRCVRSAYARYTPRIGREPAPMSTDFQAQIQAGRVRIIEREDKPAGYAVIEPRAGELHLHSVAILPAFSGMGLGRTLMQAIEDEARHLGLARITLYTNALMHENLAWYPRLGYRETGRGIEHGFDRVFFEKRLADADGG